MRHAIDLVLTRFWFKMFGTTVYTFLFFVGYVYLLKHPAFDTVIMPATWLDRMIAFNPAALPLYLSLWVYVSLPPMLMRSRRDIVTYGMRMTALCAVAFFIFYFWPNSVPPAHIDWAQYPGMAFLKGVDAAGNACPSLHVATAVFSGLWLHWRLGDLGGGIGLRAVNALWCIGIAYSTLATRQHVAVDVLAGGMLALLLAALTGLRRHVTQLAPAVGADKASAAAAALV